MTDVKERSQIMCNWVNGLTGMILADVRRDLSESGKKKKFDNQKLADVQFSGQEILDIIDIVADRFQL